MSLTIMAFTSLPVAEPGKEVLIGWVPSTRVTMKITSEFGSL
jgi:hypothetical protein